MKMSEIETSCSKDELSQIKNAMEKPITYDEDCPPMTAEQLNKAIRMDSVVIKLLPEDMKKVMEFGDDRQNILSRLLSLALNDTELIKKCMQ